MEILLAIITTNNYYTGGIQRTTEREEEWLLIKGEYRGKEKLFIRKETKYHNIPFELDKDLIDNLIKLFEEERSLRNFSIIEIYHADGIGDYPRGDMTYNLLY